MEDNISVEQQKFRQKLLENLKKQRVFLNKYMLKYNNEYGEYKIFTPPEEINRQYKMHEALKGKAIKLFINETLADNENILDNYSNSSLDLMGKIFALMPLKSTFQKAMKLHLLKEYKKNDYVIKNKPPGYKNPLITIPVYMSYFSKINLHAVETTYAERFSLINKKTQETLDKGNFKIENIFPTYATEIINNFDKNSNKILKINAANATNNGKNQWNITDKTKKIMVEINIRNTKTQINKKHIYIGSHKVGSTENINLSSKKLNINSFTYKANITNKNASLFSSYLNKTATINVSDIFQTLNLRPKQFYMVLKSTIESNIDVWVFNKFDKTVLRPMSFAETSTIIGSKLLNKNDILILNNRNKADMAQGTTMLKLGIIDKKFNYYCDIIITK